MLGETFAAIVSAQFEAIREGDRYWHQAQPPHGLGSELAAEVRRVASLRELLTRNGVEGLATGGKSSIFAPTV